MNAAEIYEEVSQWPQEARPPLFCDLSPPHQFWQRFASGKLAEVATELAELAAEACGARWLEQQVGEVTFTRHSSGERYTLILITDGCGPSHKDVEHTAEGPTRLSAISAAIRAVNSERNRSE